MGTWIEPYIKSLYDPSSFLQFLRENLQLENGTIDYTNFIVGEIPSGIINGSNATFTSVSPFQSGTLAVYLNGMRQGEMVDYNIISNDTFRFIVTSPSPGEILTIDYIKQ